MANGANRIFEVMKNTSEETNIRPSLVVSLTVKSINPLILTRDDRLEITEDFCIFSKYIDKTAIEIGDILTAFLFNYGQFYYIEENTNKYPINTVAISPTQPDTNAQVRFKFGKNKFNKDDVLMSIGLNSFTGETMVVPALATTDFIEAYPNTFYTVNWEVGGGTNICYYTENKIFISSNISDKTFFTPSNCKYIRATVFIDALNSQLQLEPGIKSTTYESYIEKTIYVKNKEVFENFKDEKNIKELVNNDMITDEYSSSKTYDIGDYCIYKNTLYRCNTKITIAENWTSNHWKATTIPKEMANHAYCENTNLTEFTITIPHSGESNIRSVLFFTKNYAGVVSIGNTSQIWLIELGSRESTTCTAEINQHTSNYVKVKLTFNEIQYGGINVILPY